MKKTKTISFTEIFEEILYNLREAKENTQKSLDICKHRKRKKEEN